MTDIRSTTKAGIISAFPLPCLPIVGEPTLRELLRILGHMISCAMTQSYDQSVVGFLSLVIPTRLYATYTVEAYPVAPADPGPRVIYTNANELDRANKLAEWYVLSKRYNDRKLTNSSLVDRFLSLIGQIWKRDILNNRVRNPALTSNKIFENIAEEYKQANKSNREDN